METSPQQQQSALSVELNWKLKPAFLYSTFKMYEPFNEIIQRRVNNMMNSNQASEFHEILKNYKLNLKPSFQCVEVTYPRRQNNLGRSFLSSINGKKQIAWTSMPRNIRNTLLQGLVYDFDLVNAQPAIFQQVCRNAGWESPQLDNMVENRNDFLRIVSDYYHVSKSDAKKLIASLMFGGSLGSWKKSHNITVDDEPAMVQGCERFVNEMKQLTGKLKLQNSGLFKVLNTLKSEEKVQWKNELGSFLAHYLQHQEFVIVDSAMQWMDQQKLFDYNAPNRKMVKVGSYEFDGFKLWRENIDKKQVDVSKLVEELNSVIRSKFGNGISFAVKDLDGLLPIEGLDLDNRKRKLDDDIEEEDQEEEQIDDLELDWRDADNSQKVQKRKLCAVYYKWKHHFEEELGWCKIRQGAEFVRKYYENGEYQMLDRKTKEKLKVSYEEQAYFYTGSFGPVRQCFIDTWLNNDGKIKVFERLGCFPHDKEVPPNVFNIWNPYDMENVTEWTHDEEYNQFWYNHFLILCGNDPIVTEYVLDFFGQLILYPSTKPGVSIDFVSRQGAGKNTILLLCELMLGKSKVFCTANPALEVWGDFNELMQDSLLVCLNELNKKDTVAAEGFLKHLITEPLIQINDKGKSKVKIQSNHRFISFTNNDHGDAAKRTSMDDRRNLIIRCSDELIGNKGYWDHLYNVILTDMNGIKSFYEYLKSRPRVHEFLRLHLPVTAYQQNLKEANRGTLESFLMSYVTLNYNGGVTTILNKDLFRIFNKWKEDNKIVYDVNNITFGQRLLNLSLPGISKGPHTKNGETKIIDIQALVSHFGIVVCQEFIKGEDVIDQEPTETEN